MKPSASLLLLIFLNSIFAISVNAQENIVNTDKNQMLFERFYIIDATHESKPTSVSFYFKTSSTLDISADNFVHKLTFIELTLIQQLLKSKSYNTLEIKSLNPNDVKKEMNTLFITSNHFEYNIELNDSEMKMSFKEYIVNQNAKSSKEMYKEINGSEMAMPITAFNSIFTY